MQSTKRQCQMIYENTVILSEAKNLKKKTRRQRVWKKAEN